MSDERKTTVKAVKTWTLKGYKKDKADRAALAARAYAKDVEVSVSESHGTLHFRIFGDPEMVRFANGFIMGFLTSH